MVGERPNKKNIESLDLTQKTIFDVENKFKMLSLKYKQSCGASTFFFTGSCAF